MQFSIECQKEFGIELSLVFLRSAIDRENVSHSQNQSNEDLIPTAPSSLAFSCASGRFHVSLSCDWLVAIFRFRDWLL